MKRNKSEFVSAMGTGFEDIQKLSGAVIDLGGSDDDLRKLLSDNKLRVEVAELLVGVAAATTLADHIAACRFDYVNQDIIEQHFPLADPVANVSDMLTVSQKDLGGSNMTIAEIESSIDRKGWRRATLVELLVYAKAKWNGRDLFIALGSSWVNPHGFRYVPYLCEDGGGRELDLDWDVPVGRWGGACLFLVVCKECSVP